jgi:hypothetical protein
MKIGVISEGHSDRAVIVNIMKGVAGLDSSDIEALRPIFTKDETDKALKKNPSSFSSWSVVKVECESRELIDGFLSIEGQDFIVIHLDSAECADYGVQRTNKTNLRELIINQVNNWLAKDLSNSILYAIAIEEIDAWILTIYEKNDSTTTARPKEKLSRVLRKLKGNSTPTYDNFLAITKTFSRSKDIEKYLEYNHSLAAFHEEIKLKVLPKLNSKN